MSSSNRAIIHHDLMDVDDGSDTSSIVTENSNTSSDYSGSDSSVSYTATDGSDEQPSVSLNSHNPGALLSLDKYGQAVKLWTERVPIGLGLCPWAIKSRNRGCLKYVTCEGTTKEDVSRMIILETDKLCRSKEVPPLSTTLIVCPHVPSWNKDFQVFDQFVKSFESDGKLDKARTGRDSNCNTVTLVSFHPIFLRWRGLTEGTKVGSIVQSHRGMAGFRKSSELYTATILETVSPMFGQRKVKILFHDDQKEQYVPVDWLIVKPNDNTENLDHVTRPPLPENLMHRSPHPTIHLIRDRDLGSFCARDVSRVKRLNAQKINRLGWEGVEQKLRSEN